MSTIQTPAGWNYVTTGGGCDGWQRDLDAHRYFLITDEANAPTDLNAPCTLSLNDDGDTQDSWECANVAHALAIAAHIIANEGNANES